MGQRENLYIWGMKRVLGSNGCVHNEEEQKKRNLLRPSLTLSDKRAQFKINFGKEDLNLDSELVVGLILEYICFLCQKEQNDTYENLSLIASKFVENHSRLCISVGACRIV